MTPRAGRARLDDAGETLVELLVSVVIIGIAVVAVLASVSLSSSASSLHRGQAQAQNLLRNWAEKVSAAAYTPCADRMDIIGPGTLPAGFTANVVSVRDWDLASASFKTDPDAACAVATDAGLQLVSLELSAPSTMGSFVQSLNVVVRKPCPTVTSC